MPVKSCSLNGKPGFRYGERGKCYTYTPGDKSSMQEARRKANSQGIAIRAAGYVEKQNVVASSTMGSGIKNPQQGYGKKKKKNKIIEDIKKNLDTWFRERWVDISRPKNSGGYEQCGRKDASTGRYPRCVPASTAARMSKSHGYRIVNKIADDLDEQEALLADMLIFLTKRYGKFNEDEIGVWAGYDSPEENDVADIGVKCANCVLYQGEGLCKIISQAVEPEGKCRFAIIPDGVVSENDISEDD